MAIGGNTLEEVIGLMTAGTEITQNASKVARGLVTVQSRLNQITDEESSTGQKLSAWYEQHNVEIYDQEGQLRKLYDVLKDVGAMWGDLTTNEKDYYLNIAAGANQSQNLASILSNFEVALSSTATAYNSYNSAAKENERVLDSIKAKQQALNAAIEDFSNKVVSSNLIKGILGGMVDAFEKLNSTGGIFITRFGLISGTLIGLVSILGNIIPKIWGMVTALVAGNTAALALNPTLLGISLALGAVATALVYVIDMGSKYKQKQEEITKGAKQLKDAVDDSNKSYSESKTKIEATAEAAKGWMKRVEELTNKTSLNADEQYELNELVKRLNENIPNLGLEIDKVTGKIKGETTEIYKQIEAWKKLAIEQGLSERVSTQSSALAEAQIGRQEAVLQRKDLVSSIGGEQTYREMGEEIERLVKYGQSRKSQQAVAHYFGYEKFSDLLDAYGAIYDLDQTISAYDKEIAEAEKGLKEIEKLRNSMLDTSVEGTTSGSEVGTGIGAHDTTSGEAAFGETTVSGTSATGKAAKPNLKQILEGQEEVEEVLEKSFEEQYKDLKHSLTMDYIAEEDYYNSLEKLYKSFYEEGSEDYQKYEEEVYKGRKKLAEDEASAQAKAQSEAEKAAEKAQQAAEKAAKEAAQKAEDEEKAAKEAYEKAFDDQLDLLDHKLAMDEITEDEYYKSLDTLNQKFFKNKEEYLDKYWKYEEKIYAYRKKLAEQEQKEQEKALEEFKKLQEERIKSLKDEVEAYNDLIKEQLDALKGTEDAINDKYDAEIAKIEETNKALEEQIEYEKMLEELAKAKNTRKLVYTEEGYKYVEDTDAIASAQSKIDAYNKNKQIEAQKQALAWDRDLQLGAIADRRSALEAQQERWSNLSSLLGGVDSSMGDVDIIELMKANSASWGTATSTEEKEKLHEANLILNELLSEKGAFNSSSGRWSMYADGTTSAMGGLSLVGERGAELRVLNHGDGIIPNGLTQNLMAWGKINPEAIMSNLGMFGGGSTNINVSNITLPNVSNAQEFLSGLESLAKQYAFQRG